MADDAALVRLRWTAGDRWDSDEYAVLIDGNPIDHAAGGWSALAQVRNRRDADQVLASWSSTVTDPEVDGRVEFATAVIRLADDTEITTSTVRLRHSPVVSARWGPVVGEFACTITHQPDPDGPVLDRRTIVRGDVRGEQGAPR